MQRVQIGFKWVHEGEIKHKQELKVSNVHVLYMHVNTHTRGCAP